MTTCLQIFSLNLRCKPKLEKTLEIYLCYKPKLEKILDLNCVTSKKTRVKERNSCQTFSDGVTELFTILSIANEMNK